MNRLREADILAQVARRAARSPHPEISAGIGDDCAIVRPRGSREEWLFTTDLLIEDVHFRQETHAARDIGHKTLARGLSDVAAMGGRPVFCLLSLAVPAGITSRWIDEYYRGFLSLARRYRTPLIGGDLGRAAKITCDVVVCGAAPPATALRRSAARPGDRVYVSGRLGGSALGLARQRGAAFRRHLRPEPRLELGQFLRTRVRASAAMDLSDGLSLDLWRLCVASGVRAEIDDVPVYPGATLEQALHGGEDYELLFTAAPERRVPREFGGVPLSAIGTVVKRSRRQAPGVSFRGEPLPRGGYDHFDRP